MPEISATDLASLLHSTAAAPPLVLDVRTWLEFKASKIPNARLTSVAELKDRESSPQFHLRKL